MRRRNFRALPPEAATWTEGRTRAEEFAAWLRQHLAPGAPLEVDPIDYHAESWYGFPPGSYGALVWVHGEDRSDEIVSRLPLGVEVVSQDDDDPSAVEVQEQWPAHLERAWKRAQEKGYLKGVFQVAAEEPR